MTRRSAASDARLVAAYRAGDATAFDALYARHRGALVRFAQRVLGEHRATAEDVVQDAMFRASRALLRDDRPIDLRPWLYRLVRNSCFDELARRRTDSARVEAAAAAARPADEDVPAAVVERRQRVRDVLGDLAALSDVQRHALMRREVDGISHAELARELDMSVPAAKSLVHRARTNLAKLSAARDAPCAPIRQALVDAHDGRRRAPAHVYRHLSTCSSCRALRRSLLRQRRALAFLHPGPVLLALLGAKLSTGGLGTKTAATASATLAVGGAGLGLGTHVFGPGDPAPVTLRSAAIGAHALPAGTPLPARTTMVVRRLALPAGERRHPAVRLACPAGLRLADLLPVRGARITTSYGGDAVVGVSHRATIVFEQRALARRTVVTVGILCKAPDRSGSIVAAPATRSASAGATRTVRPRHALLRARPRGAPVGSVHAGQPVLVRRRHHGWDLIVTDLGRRGWVPAGTLTPARRP